MFNISGCIKMFRVVLIFCVSILVWTSTCFADEKALPQINEARIQSMLNKWRANSGIPGAVLSIYIPGHTNILTFNSGTTQLGGGQRIDKNTLFQAGSITKSFTAMLVLTLEAEGRLKLSDRVTKYLPQYPQWNDVTIRQLLNHTSGIPNYTSTGRFNSIRKNTPHAGFSPAQLVGLAGKGKHFPHGKGWKYSNTNYVLAGMIIEKVTGEPIEKTMNNYIHSSTEVNLSNTYYFSGKYPPEIMARMAHGYTSGGHNVMHQNMSWASTAGALLSTSEDLIIWWSHLLQGKILSQEQLKKMMSLVCEGRTSNCRTGQAIPHMQFGEIGYGYGLGIIQTSFGLNRTGPVWWHNGTTAGFRAIVMWFPKSNIYMALMVNQGAGYLLKPTVPIIRNIFTSVEHDIHPTYVDIFEKKLKRKANAMSSKIKKMKHHRHNNKHATQSKKPKKKAKKKQTVKYKSFGDDSASFYRESR